MKEVLSCPYDELPLRSDKYATICTDIHLGNRGMLNTASSRSCSALSRRGCLIRLGGISTHQAAYFLLSYNRDYQIARF